MTNGFEKLLYI